MCIFYMLMPVVVAVRIGWGKFTSTETGCYYEGNWKDGLKVRSITYAHQHSEYRIPSLLSLSFSILHLYTHTLHTPYTMNVQEGSGVMFLSTGDSFSGEWRRGLINGPVVFKFHDQSAWNDPEY